MRVGSSSTDTAEVGAGRCKIDEEGEIEIRCFEIGSHLSVLGFAQSLDGLELYDDLSLDENVDPVRADAMALVIDVEFPFNFCREVFTAKLDQQSSSVDVLEKSRTKRLMHTNDTCNDPGHESIGIHTRKISGPPDHTNSQPGHQNRIGRVRIANIPNISQRFIP